MPRSRLLIDHMPSFMIMIIDRPHAQFYSYSLVCVLFSICPTIDPWSHPLFADLLIAVKVRKSSSTDHNRYIIIAITVFEGPGGEGGSFNNQPIGQLVYVNLFVSYYCQACKLLPAPFQF